MFSLHNVHDKWLKEYKELAEWYGHGKAEVLTEKSVSVHNVHKKSYMGCVQTEPSHCSVRPPTTSLSRATACLWTLLPHYPLTYTKLSKSVFSLQVSQIKFCKHLCYMPCPSHPPFQPEQTNNICWSATIF